MERIYHFTPHAKLMYILRDPTDRALSHLNYIFKFRPRYIERFLEKCNTRKKVMEQIHKLYLQSIERYKNCMTIYCENYCATNTPDGTDFYASSIDNLIEKSLLNGIYHVFLRKQLEIVPAESLLVVDLGELSRSPLEFMEKTVLPFVGLEKYDKITKEKFQKYNRPINVNHRYTVSFLPETSALLRQFYNNSLAQLSTLLNGRTFTWYPSYGL